MQSRAFVRTCAVLLGARSRDSTTPFTWAPLELRVVTPPPLFASPLEYYVDCLSFVGFQESCCG